MNLLDDIGSHLTGLERLKVMMTEDRRSGLGVSLDEEKVEHYSRTQS